MKNNDVIYLNICYNQGLFFVHVNNHFYFVCFLQPENSLPESCVYDLVAVVVHHGSGWESNLWWQTHTSFVSAVDWGLGFIPICCRDTTVPMSLYLELFDQPVKKQIPDFLKPFSQQGWACGCFPVVSEFIREQSWLSSFFCPSRHDHIFRKKPCNYRIYLWQTCGNWY